jgi:hypothetical protein
MGSPGRMPRGPAVMRLPRSLAHRPFALLWTGQTISRLGDSLYRSPACACRPTALTFVQSSMQAGALPTVAVLDRPYRRAMTTGP